MMGGISKHNYVDGICTECGHREAGMSSEERCPTCGTIGECRTKKSGAPDIYWCKKCAKWFDGHSPAPVDAEPLVIECDDPDCGCHGTLRPGFVCPKAPAPVGFVYHDKVNCDNHCTDGACKCCCHPKATAPIEGAQYTKEIVDAAIREARGECDACESLREQLTEAQTEVEVLKGSVEDWRKAYGDAQRELEEARALVREAIGWVRTFNGSLATDWLRRANGQLLARSAGTKEN